MECGWCTHWLYFLSLYSLLYLEYTIFIKRYPYSTDERIRRNAHVRGEVAIANSGGGGGGDDDNDDLWLFIHCCVTAGEQSVNERQKNQLTL